MKLLFINVVSGIRSTGKICTDIASAMEKDGHIVRIGYGRLSVPEKFKKSSVRIGGTLDFLFHFFRARCFDGMGLGSRRATKKFICRVRQYDPDVIHLHNIHGY
ncbi:MAG: glycosyl transferase, partial [Clostridia bacterium]|nr:glycosyl transferase [Clostridia bacterium]